MRKAIVRLTLSILFFSACTVWGSEIASTPSEAIVTSTPTITASPSPIPPTATALPTNSPTPIPPIRYGPDNFPVNVNPLTGLEVNDPTLLDRSPLSVKVQIFPRGQRPPWGITQADVIFDYYQNSGMTRFHAIFYGNNAEQVGPIRSGRLFDSQIVSMYKSILAFGGADRRILNEFLNSDFANRLVMEGSSNCPPMCRVDPNGFNYLVANTGELTKYATEKGIPNSRPNLNGLLFASLPPEGGEEGLQIFVRYSISAYARWDYDATTGRYLRFQDTIEAQEAAGEVYAPLTDRTTGQQIAADNVVVLFLPHDYAFQTKPGNNEIIKISLLGSGSGFVFRDGKSYQINWLHPTKDSMLSLTLLNGEPYALKPGNTWFQIIGQSSGYEKQPGGYWRFVFAIP